MKCLLYTFASSDSEDLKEHYTNFHKVDRNNQFFIYLFKRQNNIFRRRRCLMCGEFLLNHWFKVNQNFLVHYGAGRDTFDEKALNYARLGEIQKYDFALHSQN